MHGIAFLTGFFAVVAGGALVVAGIAGSGAGYATYHVGCSSTALGGLGVPALTIECSILMDATGIYINDLQVMAAGVTVDSPGFGLSSGNTVQNVLYVTGVAIGLLAMIQCGIACCGGRKGLLAATILQLLVGVAGVAFMGYQIESMKSRINHMQLGGVPGFDAQTLLNICQDPIQSVAVGPVTFVFIGACVAGLLNVVLACCVCRPQPEAPQFVDGTQVVVQVVADPRVAGADFRQAHDVYQQPEPETGYVLQEQPYYSPQHVQQNLKGHAV